jgi:hypothetical protein
MINAFFKSAAAIYFVLIAGIMIGYAWAYFHYQIL